MYSSVMRWVARDISGRARAPIWTAVLLTAASGCGFDWSLPSEGDGGAPSTSSGAGGPPGDGAGGSATHPTGGSNPTGGAASDGGAAAEGGAGGNLATTTGNPTDCRTCAQSAANGVCDTYREICDDTGSCLSIADCALDCEGDLVCVDDCLNGETRNEINAFLDLAGCTVCGVCEGQCPEYAGVCSQ